MLHSLKILLRIIIAGNYYSPNIILSLLYMNTTQQMLGLNCHIISYGAIITSCKGRQVLINDYHTINSACRHLSYPVLILLNFYKKLWL